jgi:hypothetical protein
MYRLRRHRPLRGTAEALLMTTGDQQLEVAFEQFLKMRRGQGMADRFFAAFAGRSAPYVTEAQREADRPAELADRIFATQR